MTTSDLLELVGGDRELIERLLELGEIEQQASTTVTVDVDVILRLLRELAEARLRIAELGG